MSDFVTPDGRPVIALLGRSVCGAVGSPVSYRHTTDGPGWPPIPAGADVAEGVAVDRVAADAAVFDTEPATYYGHGVEGHIFEVTPTTEPDSLRRQRETAPTFTVAAREEGQEHGDRCARTKRDGVLPRLPRLST